MYGLCLREWCVCVCVCVCVFFWGAIADVRWKVYILLLIYIIIICIDTLASETTVSKPDIAG